jgi:hypothetical protein
MPFSSILCDSQASDKVQDQFNKHQKKTEQKKNFSYRWKSAV